MDFPLKKLHRFTATVEQIPYKGLRHPVQYGLNNADGDTPAEARDFAHSVFAQYGETTAITLEHNTTECGCLYFAL